MNIKKFKNELKDIEIELLNKDIMMKIIKKINEKKAS